MTPQQFRHDLHELIHQWAQDFEDPANGVARGGLPVFYENGPEPEPSELRVWLDVEIRFYSSSLVAVGESAGRYTGVVSLAVFTKYGEGTSLPDTILGSLTGLMRRRRFGADAYTKYPERTIPPPVSLNGWYRSGLLVPFVLLERAVDTP